MEAKSSNSYNSRYKINVSIYNKEDLLTQILSTKSLVHGIIYQTTF